MGASLVRTRFSRSGLAEDDLADLSSTTGDDRLGSVRLDPLRHRIQLDLLAHIPASDPAVGRDVVEGHLSDPGCLPGRSVAEQGA